MARQELIGTDFSDYFTDPQKARAGYQQVFREGWVQDYELEVRHRDGHLTPVLYNASLYRDEAGQVMGVFAAARDITERKRAEEALKEYSAELARSNADLQQFAYVASHDLQEPLRMVASYTQLLAKRYRGKLDSDADDFIGYAVDGARRMQNLINDLLAYSRVGTRGKEFASTNCEDVLDEVLTNLQTAIEETGATVTHDPLPTVWADASQLAQVFQNLIGNALKFHGARAAAHPHLGRKAGRPIGAWPCATTALASIRSTLTGFSSFSSGCIPLPSTPAPAWAWRSPRRLSSAMADAFGWSPNRGRAPRSILRFQRPRGDCDGSGFRLKSCSSRTIPVTCA